MLDAAPLQLSVANARAEADLSAPPPPAVELRENPPKIETRNPAWTLAERWSQNSDAAPAVQAAPVRVRPPAPAQPEPDAVDDAKPESMLEIAAGTLALLGLTVVLIATLIRRRRYERPAREWGLARHEADDEAYEPLTDLNDEPLMTWRKKPKERLEIMRRSAELRDATSARIAKSNPVGSAGSRRTPTIPPGAHA